MARTNATPARVKPAESRLLTLHVVRREQISPTFARVTLGGGDIDQFRPMGFDQWFRLFLPVSETSLSRLPGRLDALSYLRYLTIAKTERPVLRNYTVRAHRAEGISGAEIDVDFVLHRSAVDGSSGPAASWADGCARGDAVALLDEGITFTPAPEVADRVEVVADETALPAVAGILASLPPTVTGRAFIEIPHADDRQDLAGPVGVEIVWVVRDEPAAIPGQAVLKAATTADGPVAPTYFWVAGEQSMCAALRRHWITAGVAKSAISFTGYWKHTAH
ncbi:siderophore-interacting protein [Microbacterium sp. P04]|uniref:siderophore-interacting protein n=1 Tax=Microbacterium sp. P04 TaxID=3366947 RepID=UPI003744E688